MKETNAKKRFFINIAVFIFLVVLLMVSPALTAQMMQGAVRSRTAEPAVTAVSPSRAETAEEAASPGSVRMMTPQRSPKRDVHPVVPGAILNVTINVQQEPGNIKARNHQLKTRLDIRWQRKGTFPARVDIFLHPYRSAGRKLCLKRNVVNNGHVTVPVPGTINSKQTYIVRVQSHDEKVYGDSKSFSFSPKASVKAKGHSRAVAADRHARGSGVAATPISIPRTADSATSKKTPTIRAKQVKLDPGIGPNMPTNMAQSEKLTKKRHINKKLNLLNPTTYNSGPGGGGGSAPTGGGTWGYDIACSVGRVNGVVPINKKTRKISIKIKNNGLWKTPSFKVGLGLQGKAKIGVPSSWLKTATVIRGGIYNGHYIYIDFKLPQEITEKTILVAGVDIAAELQEKNENNNYSKAIRIAFVTDEKYMGGTTMPDIIPSVETHDGIYSGDGQSLEIAIWNNSKTEARDFKVGFCQFDQAASKSTSKWLGTKKIPILGPHNSMLVSIPWKVHTLDKSLKFVAVADIDQNISEGKIGEKNNKTQPFIYQTGIKTLPPPIQGPPLNGFTVYGPGNESHDSFRSDQNTVVRIFFKVENSIRNDPKELRLMGDYIKISLVKMDGKEKLIIAEKAYFSKKYVSNSWSWKIPSTLPMGKYRIRISSIDGHYQGFSAPISIWSPAEAALQTANPVEHGPTQVPKPLKPSKSIKPRKRNGPGEPPDGIIPVQFSQWKIKKLIPHVVTFTTGTGPYARLDSLEIVLQYNVNKPFKFSLLGPGADYHPDAAWSYVEPSIFIQADLNKRRIFGDANHDFTGYPWQQYFGIEYQLSRFHFPKGIQPAGVHTIILKAEFEGVSIVHGVEVIGEIKGTHKKCHVRYHPHVDVAVKASSLGRGYASDDLSYVFSPPSCWKIIDMVHWARVYPNIQRAIFPPGMCR